MKGQADLAKRERAPGSKKSKSQPRLPVKLALALCSLLFALFLLELGLRLIYGDNQARLADERLSYQHDPQLGWFPIPNSTKRITGSRTITVTHNSTGFREAERPKDRKPVAVFLGDSFVWGYDVEAS